MALVLAGISGPAMAIEALDFNISGNAQDTRASLRSASLLVQAKNDGTTDPQEIFAAARADYERILAALYEESFYGGTISIRLDGREAADISLADVPSKISNVQVQIETGPRYRFGSISIAPLAPGTVFADEFVTGDLARTGVVAAARATALAKWFDAGNALAETASQRFIADHRAGTLSVDIRIAPGPKTRYGELRHIGSSSVRPERVDEIAGFPSGAVITPNETKTIDDRLRRAGAFRSVILTRGDILQDGDRLDFELELVDQEPRRLVFGAELSSTDGLSLSGMWMHRNLFGGAENLRIDGQIDGLSGGTGGIDYELGARITRPATFGPESDAFAFAESSYAQEPEYEAASGSVGIGITRRFDDDLTGEIALRYVFSEESDASGTETYRFFGAPISAERERRDDPLDPTTGTFILAEIEPYVGIGGTDSGVRFMTDARAYRPIGKQIVIAGRAQIGSVLGPDLDAVPNIFRFYSGGGGTVRGQDYQSLGVDLGGGDRTGGRSFAALSAELRARVSGNFSVVGFYDLGVVSEGSLAGGASETHSGAGLGLRYATGIGPIRLDVAVPISGAAPADDFYAYIGIGQAF